MQFMKHLFSLLFLCLFALGSPYAQEASTQEGESSFEVKMINDLVLSPNGKYATFNAIGKVKLLELKNDKIKDLTRSKVDFEFEPSFSADGKKIVFSSWNESGYGKLHIWDKGVNWNETLLITSGIYRTPSFSPDGKRVVYKKEIEVGKLDTTNQKTEGLYIVELSAGDPIKISAYGDSPIFDVTGQRVIYQSGTYRFGSFVKTFESVNLTGEDKQTLFYGKYGHEYSISPNGKLVAWQELGKIYVAPFPDKQVGLTADNQSIEIQQVSDLPGNNLSWSKNSNVLAWNIANRIYTADLNKKSKLTKHSIKIDAEVDKFKSVVALTNATIITMNEEKVITRGTIIIRDDRIEEIGVDLAIPKEAHAIDCSGKVIMPGLIDLNPTSNNYDYNLSPIKQWEYIELLRSGITTKLDGGFNINDGFTNQELIKSGKLVGPRLLNGGVTIGLMDSTIFSKSSYEHYKASNLMIAKAFDVAAVQSDVELQKMDLIVLDNVQGDTSLVNSDDIHQVIIKKVNDGNKPNLVLNKYTLHNAGLVGMSHEVGSVEKGKLADLIILNGNPLDDITKIKSIAYTVINGRVYETSNMEEVGNNARRVSRSPNAAIYESLNRAMGSACCGFQH